MLGREPWRYLLRWYPTLNRLLYREVLNKRDPSGAYVESMEYINRVFCEFSNENDNISTFDCRNFFGYNEKESGNGLFIKDLVHYKPEVNWWNAEVILKEFQYNIGNT